jgi:uncharacterized iron-regulated membrane protein
MSDSNPFGDLGKYYAGVDLSKQSVKTEMSWTLLFTIIFLILLFLSCISSSLLIFRNQLYQLLEKNICTSNDTKKN